MSLNKKQRDALPDSDFAVPETRDLPIHDKNHVSMAWKMLDKTKGLSPEQKEKAKKRIINRAKELGVNTSGWDLQAEIDEQVDYDNNVAHGDIEPDGKEKSSEQIEHEMEKQQEENEAKEESKLHGEALVFSALAMEIPDQLTDHPNQTPFKGVLTRIDEPSNNPLNGSHGKCVILPKAVAEKALSSLLGMCIDATPNFDGHDVKSKIGLITAATIVGNEIHIEGFFYGADFPDEIKFIQANKSLLGFSYEAQAYIRSLNDDPLVINDCVFTGAAVLYKNKAAYTTTSLSATMENLPMTPEEKKLLTDMQEQLTSLSKKLEAAEDKLKIAGGSVAHLVKPHADAMRACAAGMEAAGMGMHPKAGHVAVMKGMADSMEAAAAMGQLPHIYQTSDFYGASADTKVAAAATTESNAEIKKLTDVITTLASKVTDMEKANFAASAAPERKTLDPSIMHLIAKTGINVSDEKKSTVKEIDSILKDSNLTVAQRMQAKLGLQLSGNLA